MDLLDTPCQCWRSFNAVAMHSSNHGSVLVATGCPSRSAQAREKTRLITATILLMGLLASLSFFHDDVNSLKHRTVLSPARKPFDLL